MTKLMKDVFDEPYMVRSGRLELCKSLGMDENSKYPEIAERIIVLTEQNKQLTQLCRNILDAHEVFDGAAHIDEDSLEDYREMLFEILAKHKEQI